MVGLNEIPTAKDFISQNFKNVNSKSAKTASGELEGAVFNENSIIQNIDGNNNTNYSIGFTYYDTPENVFYNLVINISPSGEKSSHIFKFICNLADYPNFKAHHFDFKYFKGVTELSAINDFDASSITATSKTAESDDLCPKILIPTTPNSSGSGGSSSGGYGNADSQAGGYGTTVLGYNVSAGSGNFSVVVGTTTYYAGGGNSTTSQGSSSGTPCNCFSPAGFGYNNGSGSSGAPISSFNFYLHINRNVSKTASPSKAPKTAADCPQQTVPSGYVTIIADPSILPYLKTALGLGKGQFAWLGAHQDKLVDIYNFLSPNPTPENKAIAKAMVNANMIEDMIDDSQLNPCAKRVFTTVKNTSVCDISQVLAKLNANKSVYNTTIKSAVAPSGQPAQTIKNSTYNYTIYISTDYIGKTKLFIAASMVHEMVHAYFLSIVDDYKSDPKNNQNLYNLNSFPSLFQAYCDKKYPPALGKSSDLHHLEMANYYVDAIARALQEFQTGIPLAASTSPQQIYSDLAWGGLNKTPVFDATFPVGNPNRQRILNRYTCEQNGTPIGAGTANAQTPVGNPCN